jgi:hypothetical protein
MVVTGVATLPSTAPLSSAETRSGESSVELELPIGTVRVRGVEAAEVLRALIDGLRRRVIALPSDTKVWLAAGVTDMRRGMDGLAALVQLQLSSSGV